MAWLPISGLVPQATANGNQANGMVLKFYEPGTITPLAVATDNTGGTTTTEFILNTQGYTTLSSVEVIPHVNQIYKAVLYLDQTDADANDTGSAVQKVDNVNVGNFSALLFNTYDNLADAMAANSEDVGNFLATCEYTTGTGVGGGKYQKVAVNPGNNLINPATTDGNWLELIADRCTTCESAGAYEGNSASLNRAAMQAFIDFTGGLELGVGEYDIDSTLFISPLTASFKFQGKSRTDSIINCVGMAGMAAISNPLSTNAYTNIGMHDFSITGDSDNAIALNFTDPYQVFDSEFSNLDLSSAGSCMVMEQEFSTLIRNVYCRSTGGHCFELEGGNTTTLLNCYAKDAGNEKAGYRIYGGALMLSCNGVDDADYWGWFGREGGVGNKQHRVHMLNCNVEAMAKSGLRYEFTGTSTISHVTFLSNASTGSGTFRSFIEFINGSTHSFDVNNGCSIDDTPLAASAADITSTSTLQIVARVQDAAFSSYLSAGNTRSISRILADPNISFLTEGVYIPQFRSDRMRGLYLPEVNSLSDGSTEINPTTEAVYQTGNTVATTLIRALGSIQNGQDLTILINDSNTTMQHNFSSSGRFILLSGVSETPALGDVYKFTRGVDGFWRQY